jgi:hypothetical protein
VDELGQREARSQRSSADLCSPGALAESEQERKSTVGPQPRQIASFSEHVEATDRPIRVLAKVVDETYELQPDS